MTDLDLMIRAPRLVSTAGEMSRIVGVKAVRSSPSSRWTRT